MLMEGQNFLADARKHTRKMMLVSHQVEAMHFGVIHSTV